MSERGKFLGTPLTAGYRPSVLGYGLVQSLYTGQVPLFMLGEVEAMRGDPKIQLGMKILRAPLSKVRWQVTSPHAAARRFVDGQLRRIWNTSLGKLITYLEYGNAAGEPLYCIENGHIVFDQLRDVYARDAVPLMQCGGVVGIQVKHTGPAVSEPGAAGKDGSSPINLFPPRAFWLAHRPRNASPFGYSRYGGAWWPWLEKRGRHGATDIRRGWYVKNAFRGMRIRHPPGLIERPDGSMQSCQDYAREIIEKCEAGGVLALPNARDPETKEYLWTVEDAAVNGDLVGVREYSKDLDSEILEGLEVPPEIAQAAETGSGWSGRSVPFIVYLVGEDEIAAELIAAIVCWILRPLVCVNFGDAIPFDVEPISLLELLGAAQGADQRPGEQGQPTQPGQPNASPPSAQQPAATSKIQLSLNGSSDRGAVENSAAIVDEIIDQGARAGIIAAGHVRRRLKKLIKSGVSGDKLLEQARKLLAKYEPVLASAFSDSLLSAWLAGAARATKGLPPAPAPGAAAPLPAPPALPLLDISGNGALPPVLGIGRSDDEPEPAVRLPLIEAAARDLASRHIVTREQLDQLASEAKTTAFTAARVASEESLGRLAEALSQSVEHGGTLEEFGQAVKEALGEGVLSDGHVENIFRTNVASAYTTGLMETLSHPLVRDEFPYLDYTSVHDSRRRPEHGEMEQLGLNGTSIYRSDDPIWQRFTPPWDYECRCNVIPRSVEDAAAAGVREAQEWLATGLPPAQGEFVQPPPFSPPAGWSTRTVVRMSQEGTAQESRFRLRLSTYHGPTPPGKDWQLVGTGPKGGKIWQSKEGGNEPPEGHGDKGRGSPADRRQPGGVRARVRQAIRKGFGQLFGQKARIETKRSAKVLKAKMGKLFTKAPPKLQKSMAFTHMVATKALYAIDTPLRAGLNLTKEVARARGLPEEHVQKVAKVVNAIDQLSTLPGVGVYTHAARAMAPAIGPIAGYIPVAALSYVAYSTVRNPFATIRGARNLIAKGKAAVSTHLSLPTGKEREEVIAALLAAYDEHQGDDWWDALLHAALDHTRGDIKEALRLAAEARKTSEPPPDEEGADA